MRNAQVASHWFHKTRNKAWSSNCNLWFEDGCIYSYGRHFMIARHVKGQHGNEGILFTTEDYSQSTAGHKNAVLRECDWGRCPHFFEVAFVAEYKDSENWRRACFKQFEREHDDAIERMDRSREYKGTHARDTHRLRAMSERFAQFFGGESLLSNREVHCAHYRE